MLLAAADADDRYHDQATALLDDQDPDMLVLPATVVTETAWMIEDRLDSATEAAFVASIAAGELRVNELTLDDYTRCAELIATYADLGLGLVDASAIAIAERHEATTIATFNNRDFRVVRPSHCDAFDLVS